MTDDWLSKYVDYKVLINIEERTDRLNETKQEFAKAGIINVDHFPAVKHHIGISGCTRSHYEIVKIAKDRGYKNVLIFEDDVCFQQSGLEFRKTVESCFEQIEKHDLKPDFLYIGGRLTSPPDDKTSCWESSINSKMQYHTKIDENLYKLGGCKTTHAYIIYESAYDTILEGLQDTDWDAPSNWSGPSRRNIDFWYLSRIHHDGYAEHGDILHRKLNAYCIYPCLAGQRKSYSNILNREIYFDMPKHWNEMLEGLGG
jgi:hypothetical protein